MNRTAAIWQQVTTRLGLARWRRWVWVAAAGLTVAALWFLAWSAGSTGWAAVGRTALVPVGLVSAAAALAVGRLPNSQGTRQDRLQITWALLAMALGCWSVGHLIVVLLKMVSPGAVPRPSVADLVRLGGWACALGALAAYPRTRGEYLGRLRIFLDILVTVVALTTLGWLVFARPLAASGTGPIQAAWVVAHVIADLSLLIFLAVVFLATPTGSNGPLLALVGAALTAFLAADTIEARAITQGTSAGAAANLGWLAGLTLFGLAASVQRRNLNRSTSVGEGDPIRRAHAAAKVAVPLLAVFGMSGYVLLDIRNSGLPDWLALSVAVLLALALVLRQGVLAGELELRQYAHLVNSSADPAFVCDGGGRMQLVNPALEAATGYRAKAMLRKPAAILFANGRLPLGAGDRPERIFVTGWTGEVQWRRQDGTTFPVHLALRPVPSDYPTRPGLVGTAHDLSEQKRHEATLVAALDEVARAQRALEALNTELEARVEEKTSSLSEAYARLEQQHAALQTLDELKSEFVSLVSHELRAPLTNIGGGIELVLASSGELAPRAKRTLELVQVEILRLTQFVETILDLSALEAGRLPLYPAPMDVRPTLETVLAQFEARQGASRLRVDLPVELPPVLADERALASVLYHLVDNALKYAPLGDVSITAATAEGRLELSVTDQGPGIPPEMVETIFDKFERLNDADNRDVYGHGLGLYMARRLLEAQGGGIRAASGAGGGARLTCWVPIIEATDDE